jgi:hypothetical protein
MCFYIDNDFIITTIYVRHYLSYHLKQWVNFIIASMLIYESLGNHKLSDNPIMSSHPYLLMMCYHYPLMSCQWDLYLEVDKYMCYILTSWDKYMCWERIKSFSAKFLCIPCVLFLNTLSTPQGGGTLIKKRYSTTVVGSRSNHKEMHAKGKRQLEGKATCVYAWKT